MNATAYFQDFVSNIKTYQSNSGGTAKWEQYKSIANSMEEHQEEGYPLVCSESLSEAATLDKEHFQ